MEQNIQYYGVELKVQQTRNRCALAVGRFHGRPLLFQVPLPNVGRRLSTLYDKNIHVELSNMFRKIRLVLSLRDIQVSLYFINHSMCRT